MRLMLAALVATFTIAVVAAVFAIWPVVADAPWEDARSSVEERIDEFRCESALKLRNDVMDEIRDPMVRTDELLALLEDQLVLAAQEINVYCEGGQSTRMG